MSRERTPLAIGGQGVTRGTGLMTTEPASLLDLRNVTLRPGRALSRGGLSARATLSGEDAIIGIHPIRSQGVGACLAYNATTRAVRLYLVAADGGSTLVGTVWTLGAAAGFPRVSMTDVFDRLIIAHDEPTYAQRMQTRIYTPTAGTITDLLADLYLPQVPTLPRRVYFRGVCSYLSYLVGWGYGSEDSETSGTRKGTGGSPAGEAAPNSTITEAVSVGNDNRPEIVRISLPDDPTQFRPEHYFIAGSRGDPVLGCYEAGGELAVRKASQSYRIFGYDRPSFGIRPLDPLFGVASSRLGVVVGGLNYFWSLEGPRVSNGGASEDMALPLYLRGPAVDVLQSTDPAEAFAAYDPSERAILFIFGRWAFVWHLEAKEWSYRTYGARLFSGGILYRDAAATGLGPTSSAAFTSATPTAPSGVAAGGTVAVTATITGTLIGGEVLELWARPSAGSSWTRVATQAVSALGAQVITSSATLLAGVTSILAVRVTLSGIGQTGAQVGTGDDWPAATRGSTLMPVHVLSSRIGSGMSCYFQTRSPGSPSLGVMLLLMNAPPTAQTHFTIEARERLTGGSFGSAFTLAREDATGGPATVLGIDSIKNTNRDIEVRFVTAELTGAWIALETNRWMGPLTFSSVVVNRLGTGAYRWILTAPAEPSYSVDSGNARLQYKIGAGAFADETSFFSFSPSQPEPGFASTVYTSGFFAGRGNTESQFQARREVVWQGVTYLSIYFTPVFPT